MKKSVVLSFSGGMDSTVLLYKAHKEFDEIYTISFDYGQRHKKELELIYSHISELKNVDNKIVNLPFLSIFKGSSLTDLSVDVDLTKDTMGDPQNKNYFFNRNSIFLSILTGYAESIKCNTVWYGAAQADSVAGYFDGSREYLIKINEVNDLNRRNKVKIEAPLLELSKKEIVELGIKLKVPFDKTYTCYKGGFESCGICPACSLRLNGMISAGYRDPIKYQNQDKLDIVYKEKGCRSFS